MMVRGARLEERAKEIRICVKDTRLIRTAEGERGGGGGGGGRWEQERGGGVGFAV